MFLICDNTLFTGIFKDPEILYKPIARASMMAMFMPQRPGKGNGLTVCNLDFLGLTLLLSIILFYDILCPLAINTLFKESNKNLIRTLAITRLLTQQSTL